MSRSRKSEKILREVAPDDLQRLLRESHRGIDGQLAAIVAQLRQQSDSTYGDGKSWSNATWAGFGDKLINYGKALVELGQKLNSGKPPQWVSDQQAAYEASALGRLLKRSEQARRASARR
jgi:hypothetical protein